jgi:hypothetical protein
MRRDVENPLDNLVARCRIRTLGVSMIFKALRAVCLFLLIQGAAVAGRVHLLPAGPMVADGTTPVTIHIWIPQLATGDKVKIKPGHGKIGSVQRFPGGIVAASWIPAREGGPRDIPLTVTIRRRGSPTEVVTLQAPLVPPREGSIVVEATGEWEPGQDSLQIRFTLQGTSDQAVGDRRLMVDASVGSITEAVPLGDGTFSARWTPPAAVPQARTAIITAVDAAAPTSISGWTTFPLLAKQSLSFGATPDSQNVLLVGEREYGPAQASPAGTVAFDALAHPAVRKGTLRSMLADGRSLDVPVNLPLAEYPRVTFFPQPKTIPTGNTHTILLAATTPTGSPLNNPTITVRSETASLGTASPTNVPGVYALVTQIDGGAHQLKLYAIMKDPAALVSKLQEAEAEITVLDGLPTTTLTSDPDPLPLKGRLLTFNAKIEDGSGNPMRNSLPGISAVPGRLVSRTTNRGDGKYQHKFRPEGDLATAIAVPRFAGSSMTAAGLVVWPAHAAVPTDGKVQVLAAVVDAYGHPIPNQEIELSAPGGGTFPSNVKSGKNGIAIAEYTANANPGLFTVNARAGGLLAQTGIFHGDSAAGPGPVLSGDSKTQANRALLGPVVGTIRVNRAPPPPPPPAAAPTQPPSPTSSLGHLADDLPFERVDESKAGLSVESFFEFGSAPTAPASKAVPAAPAPAAPAPVAAAPTAAPVAAAPVAARPRATGSTFAGSSYEITAGLLGVYHGFSQTAEAESETVPPSASYSRPLAPGLRINVDCWVGGGPWAIAGEVRVLNDVVAVGDMVHGINNVVVHAGGKYQLDEFSLGKPYALAGLERNQTTVFQKTPSTPLAPAAQALYGARVGGGVVMEMPSDTTVDFDLSELFAPYPIATRLGATATRPLFGDVQGMAGLDMDFKHIRLAVDGTPIKISDNEIGIAVGLKYSGL